MQYSMLLIISLAIFVLILKVKRSGGNRTNDTQSICSYYYEWGKGPGERKAAGIFTYTKPRDIIQKNHNKEALALLETKKSQMVIDAQSIGTPFVPAHRFKSNFLDYYSEFVDGNKRPGNRHLEGSLAQFKSFVKKPRIVPMEITENLCKRFRNTISTTIEKAYELWLRESTPSEARPNPLLQRRKSSTRQGRMHSYGQFFAA